MTIHTETIQIDKPKRGQLCILEIRHSSTPAFGSGLEPSKWVTYEAATALTISRDGKVTSVRKHGSDHIWPIMRALAYTGTLMTVSLERVPLPKVPHVVAALSTQHITSAEQCREAVIAAAGEG